MKGRCGRRRKQLLDDLRKKQTLKFETESTKSRSIKKLIVRGYGRVRRRAMIRLIQ
jgi:hypothetical protein